jgi:hypothetical protein
MGTKRQTRKVGVAGGFINQMMGNNISVPVVGEGATILSYSDREAYEVISVNEDSSNCVIRLMDCKFVGSGYGDEKYTYSSNKENYTKTITWNEKKQCWGEVSKSVEIIKALQNRLYKEYGYGWTDYLSVPYDELIDGERIGVNTIFKLVEGVTKEYTNFYPVSIIFGVMDKYRDPTF